MCAKRDEAGLLYRHICLSRLVSPYIAVALYRRRAFLKIHSPQNGVFAVALLDLKHSLLAAALLLLAVILLDRAGKIRRTPDPAAIGVIPAAAEAADGDAGAEDGDADATEAAETPAETAVPDTPDDDKGDA